jgi:carbon-monoxide dehydrogenase small subunit
MTTVEITLNGKTTRGTVEPRTSLADFIRNDILLTGTHLGCEHGVCGACTLLVDDRPVRSCIMLAVAADGTQVRTVEGYRDDPVMDVIRDCFAECHALQCGFCTPGMLATAYDIVKRLPTADRARIREELSGNLCRCTGYIGIINAIEMALHRIHGRGK